MPREQHRVSWSDPHTLSDEERTEYAGYVITPDGVASPDCFTPEEITLAQTEGRIVQAP